MIAYLELLARLVVSLLGLSASGSGLWEFALLAAIGIAGTAAVLYARNAFVQASIVLGLLPPEPVVIPSAIARMLAQSDPDADGKPRPRAPGRLATTVVR